MRRLPLLLLVPFALILALLGQTEERPLAAAHPMPVEPGEDVHAEGQWHLVEAGEDLRTISRRYYGSGRQWRVLQVANDVGLEPRPGLRLWIPGAMAAMADEGVLGWSLVPEG